MILDMCKAVYNTRSGIKHLIHLVIQSHMDNFEIALNGSVYFVMRAVRERCGKNLRILDFRFLNLQIINTNLFENIFLPNRQILFRIY